MSSWIKMSDEKPEHGQQVFYYFEVTGVHAGIYEWYEWPEEEIGVKDCFSNESGFLCDDVTHWMPRSKGDAIPKMPYIEKKELKPIFTQEELVRYIASVNEFEARHIDSKVRCKDERKM